MNDTYDCPSCHREFKTQNSLNSHKRFCIEWRSRDIDESKPVHQRFEIVKSIPSSCPLCSREFKNIYKMSGHLGHCSGKSRTNQLDSHRGWNKGTMLISTDDVFLLDSPYSNTYIKKVLLFNELKEKKCDVCKNDSWMNQPLVLELHHINGKRTDNTLCNLQILCPNCHSQTDNWRGKNKGKVSDDDTL